MNLSYLIGKTVVDIIPHPCAECLLIQDENNQEIIEIFSDSHSNKIVIIVIESPDLPDLSKI